MATAIQNLVLRSSTDAEFRAWGSAISQQMAAMGWVKTADTGQIDWTTVLAPTIANQVRGYEMWRMDDALQATAPAFLRIAYGTLNLIGVPAIWLRVGVATDGSGNLLTRFSAEFGLRPTGSMTGGTPDANGAYECAFSGSTNRFCMALGLNAGVTGIFFAVERTRNASGNDTADGIVLVVNAVTSMASQVVPFTGPVLPIEPIHGYAPQTQNSVSGTDVLLFPIYPMNGVLLNPMRSVIAYKLADVTAGTIAQASIYGVMQTFLFLGGGIGYRAGQSISGNFYFSGFLAFGHKDNGAAIRWE